MLASRQAADAATGVLYMAEPPLGQVRYTSNAPNLHHNLMGTAIGTTVVALAAVSLRIFTRTRVIKGGLHIDDYMVIIAMLVSLALFGCNFKHMAVGLGYHMWDVRFSDFGFDFQVMTLVGTILYATSLAFTKLSILFLYLRLSPQKWFRILVWTLAAIVITYVVVYNFMSIFGCQPVAATWNLEVMASATCMDPLTKYMSLSILNIIIDVFTLVLPIPVVAPLQMSMRQKVVICSLFATGSFVCIVAIRRTTLLPSLLNSTDYTWDAVEQFHWCFTEVNAAILCASIPALKPFFVKYIPGLLSSKFGSYGNGDYSSKNSRPFDPAPAQNKLHRQAKEQAIELQSRDDVSDDMDSRHKARLENLNQNDDEAKLWDWKSDASHVSTALPIMGVPSLSHESDPRSSNSIDSPKDAAGMHRGSKVPSKQIYVTSETKVSYGSS